MGNKKESGTTLKKKTVTLFFVGLLLMVVLEVVIGRLSWAWGRIRPGWVTQLFGVLLTFAGIALVIWSVACQYTIGNGTPYPKVGTNKLVTQGPYSYTRNPMTLGAVFLYNGIGVWMGSGVLIILVVLIFSLLLKFINKHETRELAERFGKEYLDYRARTPFLLPNFRRKPE